MPGQASGSVKARFERSKEKRSDCRLLILDLAVDGQGFPKASEVFSGNQSEPETLLAMVNRLQRQYPTQHGTPTVAIDAGMATEENLKALKNHYHYIAVSRKRFDIPNIAQHSHAFKTTGNSSLSGIDSGSHGESLPGDQSDSYGEKRRFIYS